MNKAQNQINRKLLSSLGLKYGLIVAALNYLGYLIVAKQNMPVIKSEALDCWLNYIDTHAIQVAMMSGMSFIIPTVLCIVYSSVVKEENVAGRVINIPVAYALYGSSGWFISFLLELIFLLGIHFKEGINMHSIAVSSFLNIMQSCIFIGTLSFMCLSTIQRMIIFPKYFPDGNLVNYTGSRKVSTGLIFSVFYFSVGIFPIFYLISALRNYSLEQDFEIGASVYYMTLGIVVLSFVLLIAVAYNFTTPLRKLKNATEHIKSGQYDKQLDVVSNDEFGDLSDNFNSMSQALLEKSQRITQIQNSIIRGMAIMVESRDNSTGGHIARTSECVRVFVEKMKADDKYDISDSFERAIIKAAPMHDLGKIAVDDAILRKPGRFEPEEFEKMKVHAAEGAKIVAEVLRESDDEEFKKIAVNVAHYHHEKWDGSGYPTHISGTEIPYEARIMALADVFDALVSKRCYKDSMSFDKAFSIIEESLGQHFDPELGAFFITCRPELEELYCGFSD